MAEFEEIGEVIEESSEGIEEEAGETEGLTEEETEELEEEAETAKENVSKLGEVVNSIKELDVPSILKSFGKFILKQTAIAAVFYGVSVLLKKLMAQQSGKGSGESAATKDKIAKIKALQALIKDLNDDSHSLLKWLKDNENVTMDLGGGFTVPLPDIYTKYTKPISTNLEAAFEVSKALITKDNGKTKFSVPNTEQVSTIVSSCRGFTTALQNSVEFTAQKVGQFPALSSMPIKQSDVDKLKSDLAKVENMPYAA